MGNNQKLRLFSLGRAISGAPICIGIIQLANPTKAGIITPKTIINPWLVVIWLKNSGCTICNPGSKSSALITMAIAPPMNSIKKLNQRYKVPISLWFVVNNHLVRPLAGP